MKFLVVLLVVVGVLWFALRRDAHRPAAAARRAPRLPQTMVRCAHCGVHLPQDEAVGGAGGVYCSEAHRALGHRRA